MAVKRRVLLASGAGNGRALTLEIGSVIDNKHIMVGIQEGTETVMCLHLTKRELLRNVVDLCCEEDCENGTFCESCGRHDCTDVEWREQTEQYECEECYRKWQEEQGWDVSSI